MSSNNNHKSFSLKGELYKGIGHAYLNTKTNNPEALGDCLERMQLFLDAAKCELYDALGSDKVEDVAAVIKKWFGELE